jgi:hypothetical protein
VVSHRTRLRFNGSLGSASWHTHRGAAQALGVLADGGLLAVVGLLAVGMLLAVGGLLAVCKLLVVTSLALPAGVEGWAGMRQVSWYLE